ncbi:MAG: hypothetical protein AAF291_15090 [Pseudomonadota bacterium]
MTGSIESLADYGATNEEAQVANERYSQSGTFFDHGLSIREPEGKTIVSRIQPLIERVERRIRALKPSDRCNRDELLRRVAANALSCSHHRSPSRVAYHRQHGAYSDAPPWLNGRALGSLIDLLSDAGLLDAQVGFSIASNQKGRASTFEMTKAFEVVAFESGVSAQSLLYERPRNSLVMLRTGKGDEREDVLFQPNHQTEMWADQLVAINSFIAAQDISIAPNSDELEHWLEKLNETGNRAGMLFVRPELFRTGLFRSFTTQSKDHISFAEGGRLYGPWWTNAPRDIRKTVQINGKPTVELDYSSLHLRMLYHETGLKAESDLYRLDQLEKLAHKHGLEEKAYRPWVKRHTQALINCSPAGRPHTCKLEENEFGPSELSRKELVSLIEAKHQPIADTFKSGAGLRLQRIDSDIALEITSALMGEGIVVLPIHDSFVVQSDHETRLCTAMKEAYFDRLSFYPDITKKDG